VSLYVTKYERPMYNPFGLLTFPGGLREIIFVGPISCHYFDAFLRKCRHLRVLVVAGPLITTLPVPSQFKGKISVQIH